MTALTNMTGDFVDDELVRSSRMWLMSRVNQLCSVRVHVGGLFCLVQFRVVAAIGSRWRCMRCTAHGDYVWDAELVFGDSTSAHFQDAVRWGCTSLTLVARVARQVVRGLFYICSPNHFIDEDLATSLQR